MAESDSIATSTIAVQTGVWSDPVLAAMVAPPVVVTSCRIAAGPPPVDRLRLAQLARSRANMPAGRHRSATR